MPGGDLVGQGLSDPRAGVQSEAALLLLVAKPRLEGLGISLAEPKNLLNEMPSHALYDFLARELGDDAHSRYNSLIRRIVSFAHALEREHSRAVAR